MKSSAPSERLDLARDLPTSVEDTAALQRVRSVFPLDLETYIRFLEQLPPATPEELRAKNGPRADRPFAIT